MTPVCLLRSRYGGLVTDPGETVNAPIKVVPIYLDPIVEEEAPVAEAPVPPVAEPVEVKRRTGLVGGFALLVALVAAVMTGVAVSVASNGGDDVGTVLAWVAIGCSALAILGGVVAAVFRLGRGTGIAAIILGVLANPWFLVTVLGAIAPA